MKRWWRRWRRGRASAEALGVTAAYARWAPSYAAEAHNPLMALEQAAVLALLPPPAGRRVLDLACGSGRYLARLSGRGAAQLLGLDLSWPMLAWARAVSSQLAQADLRALPLPSAGVDLIICGLAVGHVADLPRALSEMARVLAPGGVLVYSDFHPLPALAGLQRTFTAADGRAYAVEHHVHLYSHHHAACAAAGLALDAVREPLLDSEHPWRGRPVVLVLRAVKPP
ncbi:MAG: methyltransferase domain-containing protein [Anaerolineales bacterium]|nr:methyltransferase domain-containing protein [Anaerolineales bacterium]